MSEVMLKLLLANVALSVAILAVMALRRPLRRIFGAGLAYSLWLLAPLAALASLAPPRIDEIVQPGPDSAPRFEPSAASPLPETPNARVVAVAAASAIAAPTLSASPAPLPPSRSSALIVDPWGGATFIWLVGVIAMLVWQLRSQLAFLAEARSGLAGPAVAGFLKPRIIIPADFEERFEASERDVVLAHERLHLARQDARINGLAALARSLCWFNPLVHIAAHLMRIDQELACDAAVVARHPRTKAAYASALLKAELAGTPLPLGCYWPAMKEHPLTERIQMLSSIKPTRARRIAGAGVIALLAISAGGATWAAIPAKQRVTKTQQQVAAVAPPAEPTRSTPGWMFPMNDTEGALFRQSAEGLAENQAKRDALPLRLVAGTPILLRGTIEKVKFDANAYTVYVRAYAADDFGKPDLSSPLARGSIKSDSRLWALSQINYFERGSIESDLMGKEVEVRGLSVQGNCEPGCRVVQDEVLFPQSSEVPKPSANLISAFARWYDTEAPNVIAGNVERLVFDDASHTVDLYVRSEARKTVQSRMFQVRMESSRPHAEIERLLSGKWVKASGWRARETIGTFCAPVCGMFADTLLTVNPDDSSKGVWVTPNGAQLMAPLDSSKSFVRTPSGMTLAPLSRPAQPPK